MFSLCSPIISCAYAPTLKPFKSNIVQVECAFAPSNDSNQVPLTTVMALKHNGTRDHVAQANTHIERHRIMLGVWWSPPPLALYCNSPF